jgi:[ribosomal protein S5]-alanine N-acetyltransferase
MTRTLAADGLADSLVRLRPVEERDLAAYAAAYRDDGDLGRLQGFAVDPDEAWARENAAHSQEAAQKGEWVELAICNAATDDFVGALMLLHLDWTHRRCELGYWLIPQARGKGLVDGALALALDWAFTELELLRVEIATTVENTHSQAVARRHGFTREALQRARDIERGKRVDVIQFGLLREEHSHLRG